MITEICTRDECTGCAACMESCPVGAIEMEMDGRGFLYPSISYTKCIECSNCVRHCHVNSDELKKIIPLQVYGAQAKNDKIRKAASSGGIVPLLANAFFDMNGAVAGAVFEDGFLLHEELCFSKADYRARGFSRSKYVQSEMGKCFEQIKKSLRENKPILFVGTPCQVAAVKTYIGCPDSLYTVDFVCHCAPSPKIFEQYLKEKEVDFASNIVAVDFRIKRPSWSVSSIRIQFENGKKYFKNMLEDPYCVAFLSNMISRESCYQCKYATEQRVSDITVCDYWGFKPRNDELRADENGTSAILVNTEKGSRMLCMIKDAVNLAPREFQDVSAGNLQLTKANEKPANFNEFWYAYYEGKSFVELCKQYFRPLNETMSKKDYYLLAYGNSHFVRTIVKIYLFAKKIITR